MTEGTEGGINIQLTAEVSRGRSLLFLTHLDRGASADWINVMLDKLNGCADRAVAKYELEALEFQLANEVRTLAEMQVAQQNIHQRHINHWNASNRKGPMKLGPKEEQELANSDSTIERLKQMIGVLNERIAQHKAKIGDTKAA